MNEDYQPLSRNNEPWLSRTYDQRKAQVEAKYQSEFAYIKDGIVKEDATDRRHK
jgi:hypothetical protein